MSLRVDPNPTWLISYMKRKLGLRHGQRERPWEDTERRWPFASQGQRPWKKPTLPTLDLGLPDSRIWKNKSPLLKPPRPSKLIQRLTICPSSLTIIRPCPSVHITTWVIASLYSDWPIAFKVHKTSLLYPNSYLCCKTRNDQTEYRETICWVTFESLGCCWNLKRD